MERARKQTSDGRVFESNEISENYFRSDRTIS